MMVPMAAKARPQESAGRFVPANDTRTLSDGSSSATDEAPISASKRTLAARGGAGMAPEAAIRLAWRAASAEAAAVGFPAGALARAAIVAACREIASPPSACWHQPNQAR